MSIPVFLAMTAWEMAKENPPLSSCGWMACHYLPGGGLTDFPQALPPGSVILVDDSVLPHKQSTSQILSELTCCIHRFSPRAIVLDFQKNDLPENRELAKETQSLPCPVIVSEKYGKDINCPILLPPIPPHCPPKDYLNPYAGREIWLEISLESQALTLTKDGCREESCRKHDTPLPFYDAQLFTHYGIACDDDAAVFILRREWSDLQKLLEEAKQYGVNAALGLYQEFMDIKNPPR